MQEGMVGLKGGLNIVTLEQYRISARQTGNGWDIPGCWEITFTCSECHNHMVLVWPGGFPIPEPLVTFICPGCLKEAKVLCADAGPANCWVCDQGDVCAIV